MVKTKLYVSLFAALFVVAGVGLMTLPAFAQDADHGGEEAAAEEASGTGNGLKAIGLGLGAALAVGLAGLATGNAQAGVGAGGTGAMAERPELFAQVLILFAIPETIVIFGFVIAILLLGNIT